MFILINKQPYAPSSQAYLAVAFWADTDGFEVAANLLYSPSDEE